MYLNSCSPFASLCGCVTTFPICRNAHCIHFLSYLVSLCGFMSLFCNYFAPILVVVCLFIAVCYICSCVNAVVCSMSLCSHFQKKKKEHCFASLSWTPEQVPARFSNPYMEVTECGLHFRTGSVCLNTNTIEIFIIT